MDFKKILGILAGAVFCMVLLQNTQVVTLRFLFWQLSMSQVILIPLIALFGLGMGFWWGKNMR